LRSLIATSQLQDAIGIAKQLIATRGTIVDSIVAEYVLTLAILERRVGANDDAESSFSKADALYEAVARDLTSHAADLQQALRYHAEFRRTRGDTPGAAALDRRAGAITVPDPSATALRRTKRQLDGITIVESKPALITAEDLRQIRTMIAPKRAWWIAVDETSGVEPDRVLGVRACTEPDIITATFHRGTCTFIVKRSAGWTRSRSLASSSSDEGAYLRVPQDGTDPTTQPPIRLDMAGDPLPPDQVIADAIRFVRSKSAAWPTGKQKNDVQPFPVETIWVLRDQQLRLITRNENATAGQMITVKRTADGWEIVEMR
jgi:hypothetical protein